MLHRWLLLVVVGVAVSRSSAQTDKVTSELVGPDVVRFTAPGVKPESALPSFALERPLSVQGPAPAGFPVEPVFGKVADGRFSVSIGIEPGTSLYGTGEVGGPLLRNGRTVTTWNTDAFGYAPDAPSLYQSHPWVLAVRPDGSAFGVLADTTYRTEIKLDGAMTFTAEGPAFPLVVINRASPLEVCTALADLVGKIPLPPLWALGYHQCRYSYNPEAKVREVAENFRKRRIPCDVLWFDIDYMAGYRVFTYDPIQFPNPKALNADLEAKGFKSIFMIDPGFKVPGEASPNDPSAEDLAKLTPEARSAWMQQEEFYRRMVEQGTKADVWLKTAKGERYAGAVWPGMCWFPDYTSPAVRTWWAGLYKEFMPLGIDGVWNDMNEPAIFNVASKTMPEDTRHVGGTWSSGPGMPEVSISAGDHARFHNVYGMLMAQGTRDGIAAALPEKRPFVLTRAGYIGSHRYAATWTGDNSATWNDLEQSIPMVLNLGLSGQPLSGPDIGGFNGNGPSGADEAEDRRLKGQFFARWMGFGALLPFARGHTAKGNIDKEPWSFGPEVEQTCRLAIERRYRLLPYLYTLFREASVSGAPVARPLFFLDPKNAAVRSEDDAFLLGGDLLVQPEVTPFKDRAVVDPPGIWRQIELVGEKPLQGRRAHADLPVLKIRAGAIIPCGPLVQFSGEKPLDPVTLLVSPNEHGEASGELYEDAGDGFGYQRGEYRLTRYVARCTAENCTITIESTKGSLPRPRRSIVVQFISDGPRYEVTGIDGEPIVVKFN